MADTLQTGQTYYYQVRVQDADGNYSEWVSSSFTMASTLADTFTHDGVRRYWRTKSKDANGIESDWSTYGTENNYFEIPTTSTSSSSSSTTSSSSSSSISTYSILPPDELYSNDSSPGAQSGETNPIDLTDTTPVFSARVCPNGYAITEIKIQVCQDPDFPETDLEWDSPWMSLGTNQIATGDVDTNGGARITDQEYGQE